MPMSRLQVATPTSSSIRARQLALACALALGLGALPAHAQFGTSQDNDLTNQSAAANGPSLGNDSNDTTGTSTTGTGDYSSTSDGTRNGDVTQLRQTDATRSRKLGPDGKPLSDQPEPRDGLQRLPRYQPGEFELYVQKQIDMPIGHEIRRFGANLLTDPALVSTTQDPLPAVPGDYIVRPGDEVVLTVWGTVDANLRLVVDRSGRIAIPKVGSIEVAGLKNSELPGALSRRVGQVFKNFQLTATLGQVRAIRVFVGGYAQRPGSITLNGLASVLHAIMRAGGPSAAGSFRDIHLRRGGKEVAVFDLYDLLLKGDRDTDQLVQPDDVIFIGPAGPQVAVLGSVNQQAIYEMKPGETLDDVLRMAGGFNSVADRSRVAIERLADRATGHVTELALPAHGPDRLASGDLIRVFSYVTATQPKEFQNERVRVEGEVAHPGDYILPPGSHIADALRAAGGLTGAAFPYGTEFTRDSVRVTQQVNYDKALRDLESDMAKNQASQRATSAEELTQQSQQAASNQRLIERLRSIRPTGRIVLPIQPDATALPDLALEDGDTINIPVRGSSVGVFGSVFTTGSFIYEPGHTTQQYLNLAGGPTVGADKDSMFLIRANGSVISARQGASFWHSNSTFRDAVVQPGDTLFVPEELDRSTFVQDAKDWTQILYQFGLGLAGIKSLGL